MSRATEVNYKNKTIFQMDFSNINKTEEINTLIQDSIKYIRNSPESSLLTLTIIKDMHFSNEIKDLFNSFMKGNKPYVKAGAVVGLNGLQMIIYNSLVKLTGRDIRSFSSAAEAKDWLVTR